MIIRRVTIGPVFQDISFVKDLCPGEKNFHFLSEQAAYSLLIINKLDVIN